jgi:cytochrome c oxidase cbb3-type subunit 2
MDSPAKPIKERRLDDVLIAVAILIILLLPSFVVQLADAQDEVETRAKPATLGELRKADLVERGQETYRIYCGGCHGESGDGAGPAARFLDPKPRDLTSGVFKFRSTPSGALPTDADLHRVLTQGVLGTSMPSWQLLPENQRIAVIEYIKTLSDEWESEYSYEAAIAIPGAPDYIGDEDSIVLGRGVYELMQCAQCHGEGGKGDGPAAEGLTDDWGEPILPFDFTGGALKGGSSPGDVFRTFSTGLNGTPMPSYGDILSNEDRWNLVSYILSLRSENSGATDTKEGR